MVGWWDVDRWGLKQKQASQPAAAAALFLPA